MKERFISSGGAIFEGKSLSSIYVYDDRAVSKFYFVYLAILKLLQWRFLNFISTFGIIFFV